jgi:hypothetical protein
MEKMARINRLIVVITLLLMVGMFLGTFETGGPDHQQAEHHCISCCISHHFTTTVFPLAPTGLLFIGFCIATAPLFSNQAVARQLERPPKFLIV